ncbi:MAG TPA: caspase family protein [Vicinamibacterales bacterium]|nr:caspase family protein [Vicinamibacterales bacterium]
MTKRALLIGINKYQVPGADLRGCVNDVKNLREALINLYGFKSGDVVTLTDAAATKKAMQARITRLVRDSKKGDVAVLHYSGHGSHVPDDANLDEADGRDEILCPTDLDWEDPLRDDWLRTAFDKTRAGVSLTVIMDCCHSGTNTRAILPPDAPVKERYLPSPWDLMVAESGRRSILPVRTELRKSSRSARKTRDIVKAELPEVLITGCRDTQTSADAFIDGVYTGALTYSLVQAMQTANGRLTYKQLHDRAVTELKKRGFDQVPQLEGRSDQFERPLFSPV